MDSHRYVSGGSVLVLSPVLGSSQRDDVTASTLYMQLASTNKHPEFKDFDLWCEVYSILLRRLHFNVLGTAGDVYTLGREGHVSVASVIDNALERFFSREQIALIHPALQSLSTGASNCTSLQVLTRHAVEPVIGTSESTDSQGLTRIRLQVGLVDETATLKMLRISFAVAEPLSSNFMSQQFMADRIRGSVHLSCFQAQLTDEYEDFSRSTVLSILGTRREDEIVELH
ncbi:hypothetical protein [Pseudomonas frederiksbergensis]|uniref:Uncharacterized protein n=1 Tax=Pseudomonas frederiksbergensis TaxID=104087 RepID=A0A423KRT9_9PSED|nr:hypothetical protein [Pseudomonas frederiksbergensis]RON58427.1 hypothetical protein BK665_00410 [Pseudomonas frederiksbergensis]